MAAPFGTAMGDGVRASTRVNRSNFTSFGRWRCERLPCLAFLAEAITIATDIYDGGTVEQPVQSR